MLTRDERIAQVTRDYYRQADDFSLSAQELFAWYRTLLSQAQADVVALGPYHWAVLPAFKRYVLEKRGHSLSAYLKLHLTPAEFAYWCEQPENESL
jgi:hypothetical protein